MATLCGDKATPGAIQQPATSTGPTGPDANAVRHKVSGACRNVVAANPIGEWIDTVERRVWFRLDANQATNPAGR